MCIRSKGWFSAGVLFLVLLLSLSPVAAAGHDSESSIAQKCARFLQAFERIADVKDIGRFAKNVEKYLARFAHYFKGVVDELSDEDAVATPYAATETVVDVALDDFFVDDLGIEHVVGLTVTIDLTGDLVGSLVLTGGQAVIDPVTGAGVLVDWVHYDVTFQGAHGTFDGCNVVPQSGETFIFQLGVGGGPFEGMILAATFPADIGVLHEAGTIFALTED